MGSAAGKGIVQAPFPIVFSPVAVADPLAAPLGHIASSYTEHLRLHEGCGRRRKATFFDALMKVAIFKDVKLVEVRPIDTAFHKMVQVFLPHVKGLVWQAIHEVNDDGALIVGAELLEPLHDFFSRIDAAHLLTNLRVKGLDTQGDAVDAFFHPDIHFSSTRSWTRPSRVSS